jgi:hypothetical protein
MGGLGSSGIPITKLFCTVNFRVQQGCIFKTIFKMVYAQKWKV